REENGRRELELWAELPPDGAGSVPPGASDDRYRSITGYDVPTDRAPDGADAPAPAIHTATRRARRAARRSPSHLGKDDWRSLPPARRATPIICATRSPASSWSAATPRCRRAA